MSKPEQEPKLIIDEDWKTQVQREKEELKQRLEAEASPASSLESANSPTHSPDAENTVAGDSVVGSSTPSGSTSQKSKSAAQTKSPSLPPASFSLLVTTLATQAMAAMGLMPASEDEPAPPVNLDFSKHFIDMLSVLEDKTKGNLVEAEQTFLQDTLHQLRMAFVAVSKQAKA